VTGNTDSIHALILKIGDEEFGLNISSVKEIVRFEKVSPIPRSSGAIEGVLELRNHILAVMDLRKRFCFPDRENAEGTRIIIIRARKMIVGLWVDSVKEVLKFPREVIHPTPALVKSQVDQSFISEMIQWKKRIIFMLDLDNVVTRSDEDFLRSIKHGASSEEPSQTPPEGKGPNK